MQARKRGLQVYKKRKGGKENMKKCVLCNKKIKDGEEVRELFGGKNAHKDCVDLELMKENGLVACDYYDSERIGLKSDMFVLGYGDYTTDYSDYQAHSIIRGYHNRDLSISFKKLDGENTKLYFGFELEIERSYNATSNKEEVAHYIREHYRHFDFVFEIDSSLQNGVEIISQPMTLAYINEHKQELKDMLEYLKSEGYTSHDSGRCGLHIHISRDALGETKEEQERIINNVLLFIEFYKQELVAFSRRRDWTFCHILSDTTNIDKKYLKSTKVLNEVVKDGRCSGHHVAFNTQNDSTLEFRLFRGTLNYTTFMASIYLVANLIETLTTYSDNSKKITLDNIIKLNNYTELKEYCTSKQIYNATPMINENYNIDRELKSKEHTINRYKRDTEKNSKIIFREVEKVTKKYDTKYMLNSSNLHTAKNNFSACICLMDTLNNYKDLVFKNDEQLSLLQLINTSVDSFNARYKDFLNNLKSTIDYAQFTEEDVTSLKQVIQSEQARLSNAQRGLE